MGTSLERWTTWEKKETQNNEDELQTNNYGSKSTLRHWLAVIANRNQTFSIHREGTHLKKFAQNRRMSFTLRYVRVALATTDVRAFFNLEIPATNEIHEENRNHDLA